MFLIAVNCLFAMRLGAAIRMISGIGFRRYLKIPDNA